MTRRFTLLLLLGIGGVLLGGQPGATRATPACPAVVQGSGTTADDTKACPTVSGGSTNAATGSYATVGGGANNRAGDTAGSVDDEAYATVAGGLLNTASRSWATVGGGDHNTASGSRATVGGGGSNSASNGIATVGGGSLNTASGGGATVGGGAENTASGDTATIGGGYGNQAAADYATIAGGGLSNPDLFGTANRVTDGHGTVGGGGNNQAGNGTTSLTDRPYATVAGGLSNTASGSYANISGGRSNIASGSYATVPGGYLNTASAAYSFAAGRQARATQTGSFVWGDSSAAYISPTAPNQFIARASGGVTFYSNAAASSGVTLAPGAGSWSNLSDRAMKSNLAAVNPQAVLAGVAGLPMQTWSYTSQDASVKHIGPMAQDFAAAFGVGEDDRHISTVDADGVALAAIQGLYSAGLEKDRALAALKSETDQQIAALQERLASVEQAQRGGSTMLQVASTGVSMTISWGVIALGGVLLIVLLIVSSVSLTLLVLRRRTPSA